MEFPAPRGTPLISPHIKWDHSQTWDVPTAEDFPNGSSSSSATVYKIGESLQCRRAGGRGGFLLRSGGTKAQAPQTSTPSPLTTIWWITASTVASSSRALATCAWSGRHSNILAI